jgi:hypothetical protein
VLHLPSGYEILQACTQPKNIKDNPFPFPLMFRKIRDMTISVNVVLLFEKLKKLCEYKLCNLGRGLYTT